MESPGGQNPTFWPKITKNIGIIQRASLFGPFDNAKQPQIYIQDKVWWYLFKMNCETSGGNPIYGDPGVSLYMGTPGVQAAIFWPIKSSLFGTFDNANNYK